MLIALRAVALIAMAFLAFGCSETSHTEAPLAPISRIVFSHGWDPMEEQYCRRALCDVCFAGRSLEIRADEIFTIERAQEFCDQNGATCSTEECAERLAVILGFVGHGPHDFCLTGSPYPGSVTPGTDVLVRAKDLSTNQPSAATIFFPAVLIGGQATATIQSFGEGPPAPPGGFRLGAPPWYFDIQTTATFLDAATVCIDYSAVSYGNESVLRLLHRTDGGAWVDVTTSVDSDAKIVCGEVESFSPFLVAELNVAPVVTSIALPAHPLAVGTGVALTAHFTDANPGDTHTASVDWGLAVTNGSVDGIAGAVTANYNYAEAGVYTVHVTVSDGELTGTRSSTLDDPAYVVVYDPSAGFVTGGGWIDSPAGACQLAAACATAVGRANFGFNARYRPGRNVPDGATQFQFKAGDLSFHSQSYEWLVVAGARAQFKGMGRINGGGDYGFLLTAVDGSQSGGGGVDRFRIKIWDRSSDLIVYDNQMGEDDDSPAATALGGGRIVIHRK